MIDDDILDDLFHGCAFAAFIDQSIEEQGPPDSEATRRRAYRYYEEELAKKSNRGAAAPAPADESLTNIAKRANVEA